MNLPVATAGAAGVESQGTPSLVEGKECYWRDTHPAIWLEPSCCSRQSARQGQPLLPGREPRLLLWWAWESRKHHGESVWGAMG